MQGSNRWLGVILIPALLTGCGEVRPDTLPTLPPAKELGTNFDPTTVGTIQGQVCWEGRIPDVPPFQVYPSIDSQPDLPGPGPRPNAHAPLIDPQTKTVQNAVLFLRQVDLLHARPWDHDPVQVEQSDWQIRIHQGQRISPIGFVRRGTEIPVLSRQNILHILHGQGAAFFSMPFPDPEVPSRRRLDKSGHVELTSGAAYYWMRGHLFVADHPYFTLTDEQGRYSLPQVPPGTYQLVCWHPNWQKTWHERDPESSQISHIGYSPPLELETTVTIRPKDTLEINYVISEGLFRKQ